MRVGYADHAGVAGRRGYAPATQARCDGEGRDFTPNAVFQEGKGKTDALTLLSQAYFRVLSRSSPSARKRDLDRDRIPAFSKAGIQPSPPRHRGYAAASPRRPPPPMRVGYADHAGVAGRRGYAPATQALLRRGGRDFTPNAVFQEGKGKTDALTLLSQAYFSSAVKVKPFGRASATLTEIEYPLLVKRVFSHPSPPPRLRR